MVPSIFRPVISVTIWTIGIVSTVAGASGSENPAIVVDMATTKQGDRMLLKVFLISHSASRRVVFEK